MTRADHHIAIRVTDIEAAARFYIEALDGYRMTRPFTLGGELAEGLYGGRPGTETKICQIGFEAGALEIFEFTSPVEPAGETDPPSGNILHFCFQVDSVRETLAVVEEHGGRTTFPATPWGDKEFAYAADPWGNIFELTERSMADTAAATIEVMPESNPAG